MAECSLNGDTTGDLPELVDALRALTETGRAAWPALTLASANFVAHVRRHLTTAPDPVAAARSLNAPDLYLACACLHRVPGAIEVFVDKYLTHMPALLAGCPDALPLADEVGQVLREKLLVGTAESPPRIIQYQGRGSLVRWVQVTAVHTALKLKPSRAHAGEERIMDLLAIEDPEMGYLKDLYAGKVKRAFEEAFAGLLAEQRTLLRLHFLDGLSTSALAVFLRRHRATAARQVVSALDALQDGVRRSLHERLAMDPSEIDSVVRLVRSRLDLSLHRLLKEPDNARDG